MEGLTIGDIIKPVAGHELWDYYLYGLMVFSLVALFLIGNEASQFDTIFLSLMLFICILDKAYAWGYIVDPNGNPAATREQRVEAHITHFGTYIMRVLILVLPLLVAGGTKSGKIRAVAGLLAIAGGVYSFGRWFDEQRNATGTTGLSFLPIEPQVIAQGSMFILGVGELFCRRYLRRLRGVDWERPVLIGGVFATDDIKKEVA
jgi:hypothetical protein